MSRPKATAIPISCHQHGRVIGLVAKDDGGLGPICVRCLRLLVADPAERRAFVRAHFLDTSISAEVPCSGARVTAGVQSTFSLAPRPLPTSLRIHEDGTRERFSKEAS